MLNENDAIATVAARNLEAAKHFYEETLGLAKVMEQGHGRDVRHSRG